PLPGDSMLVVDARLARATIVAPSLQPVRSISMREGFRRGVVVRWPSEVVMQGRTSSGTGSPPSLARVSFDGADATVVSTFGTRDTLAVRGVVPIQEAIALRPSGNLWSAPRQEYRITEWTSANV